MANEDIRNIAIPEPVENITQRLVQVDSRLSHASNNVANGAGHVENAFDELPSATSNAVLVLSNSAKNATQSQTRPEIKNTLELPAEEKDRINEKLRLRNEVYEACIARRNFILAEIDCIEKESTSLEIVCINNKRNRKFKVQNNHFAKIEMPFGNLWVAIEEDETSPAKRLALELKVRDFALRTLQRNLTYYDEIIKLFEQNITHEIDIICATLKFILEGYRLNEPDKQDLNVTFLREQISKLEKIVSSDFDEFSKLTKLEHQNERNYTSKMRMRKVHPENTEQKTKKDNPVRYSINFENLSDDFERFKKYIASTPFLSKADSNDFHDQIKLCQSIADEIVLRLNTFNPTYFDFYKHAVLLYKATKSFSKHYQHLVKKLKHYNECRLQYETANQLILKECKITSLLLEASNIISEKFIEGIGSLQNDTRINIKNLFAKSLTLLEGNNSAFKIIIDRSMDLITNHIETPSTLESINKMFNDFLQENKGRIADSIFSNLESNLAQLLNYVSIYRDAKIQVIQFKNDLKQIKNNCTLLQTFLKKHWVLLEMLTQKGLLASPEALFEFNELEKNIHSLRVFSEQEQKLLEQLYKESEEAKERFLKENNDIKLKLLLKREQHEQEKRRQELEDHQRETKQRIEAFQRRTAEAAIQNKARKKQEAIDWSLKHSFEKEAKKKQEEMRRTKKIDLLNLIIQDRFRHFMPLINDIFSDPIPHYKIKYAQIENLILSLGGSISPPGSGGSHRTIKLIDSSAYFGILSIDGPENLDGKDVKCAEEAAGIVEAHKAGVPRGKLSRYDVSNIRSLLSRCSITLQDILCAQKTKEHGTANVAIATSGPQTGTRSSERAEDGAGGVGPGIDASVRREARVGNRFT